MLGGTCITRVLLIGIKPEAADYRSGSAAGREAEKIAASIETAMADMRALGWGAGFCSILPDISAERTNAASLTEPWDCVVIGGGIPHPGPIAPAVRAGGQRHTLRRAWNADRLKNAS